jgi:hypothetical protein
LTTLGIQARKDNRARLLRLEEYDQQNKLPLIQDLVPIREPDKAPTIAEQLLLTDKGHPGLLQVIRELEALAPPDIEDTKDKEDSDDEIIISTQGNSTEREIIVLDYRDSSPLLPIYDESDIESYVESIDSIQRNADFVLLE